MTAEFPVLPFRTTLYTPAELFAGFRSDDPTSYAATLDLAAYRSTRLGPNREVGMLRALHDQCVTEARDAFLAGRRVVAVMGGHAMARTDTAYRQVMTARLTGRGVSLAVPTWFYGHEPPTPFATHLAKYFSNSLREDGLLAVAADGIVFAPGRAGTLQEVFQEAAQNSYRVFHDRFSPMAFLDTDRCWTERFPVGPLLETLFGPEDYARYVCISRDPDEILTFLAAASVQPL